MMVNIICVVCKDKIIVLKKLLFLFDFIVGLLYIVGGGVIVLCVCGGGIFELLIVFIFGVVCLLKYLEF